MDGMTCIMKNIFGTITLDCGNCAFSLASQVYTVSLSNAACFFVSVDLGSPCHLCETPWGEQ